ncbi:MAG: Cof-type HAD-IIB family hydrolase [Clostridia bacterium]|nr:Cof-type HAD-IIB family hydrolase [Clostridia bacterium]
MKKYQGAVFFDIDGTLVDERQGIFKPTPKTVASLQCLQERGYLIGIATGRARCYLPDLGIDFDCYVTCNGAVCEVDGEEILNEHIPEEDVRRMIAFMEKEKLGFDLETSKCCYIDPKAEDVFWKMMQVFQIENNGTFQRFSDPSGLKINKILITFEEEGQMERMREFCGEEFFVLRHHKNNSADVGKWGMSKAVGIRAVMDHLGLKMEDTYAFGDDDNDFEMLRAVGHGIAMTPHAEGLDAVAEYLTCSVAEDGIYQGLNHYGLL